MSLNDKDQSPIIVVLNCIDSAMNWLPRLTTSVANSFEGERGLGKWTEVGRVVRRSLLHLDSRGEGGNFTMGVQSWNLEMDLCVGHFAKFVTLSWGSAPNSKERKFLAVAWEKWTTLYSYWLLMHEWNVQKNEWQVYHVLKVKIELYLS